MRVVRIRSRLSARCLTVQSGDLQREIIRRESILTLSIRMV
jgi:hypothetical protein